MSEPRKVVLRYDEKAYGGKSVEVVLELRQVSDACLRHEGHCTSLNPDGSMCACACHWSVD